MTKAEFQVLKRMITTLGTQLTGEFDSKLASLQGAIDSLRVELKQHTTDVVQEAMQTIGEHTETIQTDYTRTKNDHELRILRLEQRTP